MGKIFFEGPPPFGLSIEQTALVHAVEEKVEMILFVSVLHTPQGHVPVQVALTSAAAQALSSELQLAAIAADNYSRDAPCNDY